MKPEERIAQLVEESSDLIPKDALAEVRHYIDHDEFEVAFEGLVLELIKSQAKPSQFNYSEWMRLVDDLGLRTESVLVGDFWIRFQEWASPSS